MRKFDFLTPHNITPFSPESLHTKLLISGSQSSSSATTSVAWSTANRALFVPFYLTAPMLVDRWFIFNGAVVNTSGKIEFGLYGAKGAKITSAQKFQASI